MDRYADSLNAHYGRSGLLAAIEQGLAAAGKTGALTIDDLAPVDQFHSRGRDATLELVELAGLEPGMRVLDVGGGIGGAARLLAHANRCRVTVVDLTEEFCRVGAALTARAGLTPLVEFRHGNALDLPFPDASFDVVLSTFGVMFTPNQEKAATEMLRVVRQGGRIALACWTPESFIGQLFKTIGAHVPPPPGLRSPALWGSEARLAELFPGAAIKTTREIFDFRYKSPSHWIDVFRTYYGPVNRAFAALPGEKGAALESDILSLIARIDRGKTGTMHVPGEYLSAIVTRR